jgi:hypothetical protein
MPTTLPRTQVTHTAELRDALEVGQRIWPEYANKPSVLITRLAQEGARHYQTVEDERLAERRARILAGAGQFHGMYPPGYLDAVREGRDW